MQGLSFLYVHRYVPAGEPGLVLRRERGGVAAIAAQTASLKRLVTKMTRNETCCVYAARGC